MAIIPRCSPTTPSMTSRVPVDTPDRWRRPKNTTVMAPVSSTTLSSSEATPDHGCTRIEYTWPATLARWRNDSCEMGTRSAGRAMLAMSAGLGTALLLRRLLVVVAGRLPSGEAAGLTIRGVPDVVARWYGTMVTLQWGSADRVSTRLSAVRSWTRRCQNLLYSSRGMRTVTSVSPSMR